MPQRRAFLRVQQVALVRHGSPSHHPPNEGLTMSTTNLDNTATTPRVARVAHDETRPARKTTELIAYLATVLAVVVTAFVVGDDDNGVDAFGAAQALQYLTFLTIGYMLARRTPHAVPLLNRARALPVLRGAGVTSTAADRQSRDGRAETGDRRWVCRD